MAESSITPTPVPNPDQSGLYIGMDEGTAHHTQLDPTGRGREAGIGMKSGRRARMPILVPGGDLMPAGAVPQVPEATEAVRETEIGGQDGIEKLRER